jgi:hypothetical protein
MFFLGVPVNVLSSFAKPGTKTTTVRGDENLLAANAGNKTAKATQE